MSFIWRASALCLLPLLPLAAPAQAQPQAQTPPGSYVLGIDDQLDVFIHGDRQSSGPIRVRIRHDGSITLPLVGTVQAAGETTVSLSAKVQSELERRSLLVQPIVNVEVAAYVSRSATLLGNVTRPGVYPLYSPHRLSMVLALAGGNREAGDVVVLRREGQPELRTTVEQIAQGGANDPLLQANDLVFVPERDRFYIYGQVRQPGSFGILPGMTIRQALAQGGGPTDAGTESNLRVYRNGQQLTVAQLDTPVQEGDVLYIRERVF